MVRKLKWHLRRSRINTNKREAQRIASRLRKSRRYKRVSVVKRDFPADRKTKTKRIPGYWIKKG